MYLKGYAYKNIFGPIRQKTTTELGHGVTKINAFIVWFYMATTFHTTESVRILERSVK